MRRSEYLVEGWDPRAITVGQLMEDAVVTCSPGVRAVDVARRLSEWNVGSVPIVEEDRTLVGLVSESDLLDALLAGKDLRTLTVADVMTRPVLTATEDMAVEGLANLFQDRFLIRVPVVKDGKLVGLVARRDIIFGYLKAVQQ